MQISKRSNKARRDMLAILTAMVMDRPTLAAISTAWRNSGRGFFTNKPAQQIGEMCVDFYRETKQPPRHAIEQLFRDWQETTDATTHEPVAALLHRLEKRLERAADQNGTFNSKFHIKLANDHFSEVRMTEVFSQIEEAMGAGRKELLPELAKKFKPYNIGQSDVCVLDFSDEMIDSFYDDVELPPLINFEGALGYFLGGDLCRGSFVSIMAPEKRGKSMWLLDFAFNAMLQRNKVAFFSAGDLNQQQNIRRFVYRFSGTPKQNKFVEYPIEFNLDGDETAYYLETRPRDLKRLPREVMKKRAAKFRRKYMQSSDRLRLHCEPAGSLSVSAIESQLMSWADDGWVADVVVVDYADILQLPSGTTTRDGTDLNWQQLNSIAQDLDCLMLTATQTNALGSDAETLMRKHVSEDKRKLANVTGMLGLNQTDEEKRFGIFRLNWIVRRWDEFDTFNCVSVAGCLPIARPIVCSAYLPQRMNNDDDG